MGQSRSLRQALVFLVGLTLGCGSRGGDYAAPLSTEGPFGSASYVVALDRTDDALIAIDPLGASSPQAFALPPDARHLTLAPDGKTALVATGDAQSPGLSIVSLHSASLGQRKDLALPANPDVIQVSPDGHFALLTFNASEISQSQGQAVLDPNQVVVVDLTTDSATSVALGTDSPAPTGVIFAAPGQGGAQLVAVLFDKSLAVLDLGAPKTVLRVPVRIQGGPAVTPLKALFSGFTQGQGYLYVMAAQSDDVIAVAIGTVGGLSGSINFLAGGQGLADIALPPGSPPPSTVLALYQGSQEADQLDATGRVDLTLRTQLGAAATHLAPLSQGLLLAWTDPSSGGGSAGVFAWSPALAQAVAVQLDGPVEAVVVAPSGALAVAEVSAATPELTVLEPSLTSQGPELAASPLLLAAAAAGVAFDDSGEVYLVEQGQSLISRIDPATLSHEEVALDAPPTGLGVTTQAAFVASQSALYGQLTSIPMDSFSRASAHAYPDYLLTQETALVSGP